MTFELFLFPNNNDIGELEDLLEQIIYKENQPVMDCWSDYEKSLAEIKLPWKQGEPLTIPAKKTKIYEQPVKYLLKKEIAEQKVSCYNNF